VLEVVDIALHQGAQDQELVGEEVVFLVEGLDGVEIRIAQSRDPGAPRGLGHLTLGQGPLLDRGLGLLIGLEGAVVGAGGV